MVRKEQVADDFISKNTDFGTLYLLGRMWWELNLISSVVNVNAIVS